MYKWKGHTTPLTVKTLPGLFDPTMLRTIVLLLLNQHHEFLPTQSPSQVQYSFDYAQQVHFPSDPLQPDPIYFPTDPPPAWSDLLPLGSPSSLVRFTSPRIPSSLIRFTF